jgi:hypothetical protein
MANKSGLINNIVLLRDIWTDWNWANTENIRIGLVFAVFKGIIT